MAEAVAPLVVRPSERAPRDAAAAGDADPRAALFAALAHLDALLGCAVEHQAMRLGAASLRDPWLGMHLSADAVARLLAERRAAGGAGSSAAGEGGRAVTAAVDAGAAAATGASELLAEALRRVDPLPHVADVLGLEATDLAIVLIALAPDLDLRYERLYGYLQDDLTRRRPSSDLIANLLATDTAGRWRVLDRLSRRAPLLLHGLLVEGADPARPQLAREWAVDPAWRAWLLQADIRDALPQDCRLADTDATPVGEAAFDPAMHALLARACADARRRPLRLALEGEHGAGKFAFAATLARRLELHLVVLDLRDAATPAELAATLERAARVACLFGALLYLHGLGPLAQREPQLLRTLVQAQAEAACHIVTAALRALPAPHAPTLPVLHVRLQWPDARRRATLWSRALGPGGATLSAEALAALAQRFALSAAQIEQAAADAQTAARHDGAGPPDHAALTAAVRRQCGGELARMAQRVLPNAGFGDLVVAPEVQAQLRELCARVATREPVARAWADGSVHARVPGVTALFVGPSGTGKTLAAEAVAHELGLDLYRIDLAGIVSKYIGETEKNLDRVFAAAVHANAVLFFDEADALFGKRSEVKDAHDRYANIEVAYLLQKMEQFDGLAILATNLKQNLDEAFARRLAFTINFAFPEAAERLRLWQQLWPPHAPADDDVDLAWFAHEFRLSGGNIRNAIVAAAHLAAADRSAIDRGRLLHAVRREFQKLGKTLGPLPPAAPRAAAAPVAAAAMGPLAAAAPAARFDAVAASASTGAPGRHEPRAAEVPS